MKKWPVPVGIVVLAIITLIPSMNALIENLTHPYIVLAKPGLVLSDTLDNENKTKEHLLENQVDWHYAGSAIGKKATYDLYKDRDGLHIGIRAPSNGTYAGLFAVTSGSQATLFHALISSPVRTIPSHDYFQNGLYVQTGNGSVNYVTCVSVTSSSRTVWSIVSATGGISGATKFRTLWTDTRPDQSLTRECTIITNGQNYLKVYLDGVMAYSNSTLNLQMPAPFLAFLEVQSSYNGKSLYGTYKDYYATTDENVKVTTNLSNAVSVSIVNSSGRILATAPISGGTATLDIGKYHLPLTANIVTYNSTNASVVSTSRPVDIYGGDLYSAGH